MVHLRNLTGRQIPLVTFKSENKSANNQIKQRPLSSVTALFLYASIYLYPDFLSIFLEMRSLKVEERFTSIVILR